jgi:hypothetical protein
MRKKGLEKYFYTTASHDYIKIIEITNRNCSAKEFPKQL